MGKGSQTTTSQQGPPAAFQNAYTSLLGQAQSTLQTDPYQSYTGQMVAPLSTAQNQGIQAITNAQGMATPYINQAASSFGAATQPLWSGVQQFSPGAVNQYMSPYTSDVTQATQQQFGNLNAQQQNSLQGNAIAQGAFGGDRASVAQGILGGQQAASESPVLAGIQQQGYQSGLSEFNTQQQAQLNANQSNAWLNSQAGFGYGNLGAEAQNQALTGGNALLQAGGLQQQVAQENLNVPYYQFEAQQAAPYQQLNWLSGIETGVGSAMGGQSSTTTPGQTTGQQVAGGVADAATLAMLAMAMRRGGGVPAGIPIYEREAGGGILPLRLQGGGPAQTVYGSGVPGSEDWLAGVSSGGGSHGGKGPPPPPQASYDNSAMNNAQGMMGLGMMAARMNQGQGQGGIGGYMGSGLSEADMTGLSNEAGFNVAAGGAGLRRGGLLPHRGSGGSLADMLYSTQEQSRGGIIHRDEGGGMPPLIGDGIPFDQAPPPLSYLSDIGRSGSRGGIAPAPGNGPPPPPDVGTGAPPPPTPATDAGASGAPGNGILPQSDPYAVDYQPRDSSYTPDRKTDMLMAGASLFGNIAAQAGRLRPNYGAAFSQAATDAMGQRRFEDEASQKAAEAADQGAYRKADLTLHARQALDSATEAAARLKEAQTAEQDRKDQASETQAWREQQAGDTADFRQQSLASQDALRQAQIGSTAEQQNLRKLQQQEGAWSSGTALNPKTGQQEPATIFTPKYGGEPKPYFGTTLAAKESGDPATHITGDVNSQFGALWRAASQDHLQNGTPMPDPQQLWSEAEARVRGTYKPGGGQAGAAPAAAPPLPPDQRKPGYSWKAPSGATYTWNGKSWDEPGGTP